MKRSLITGTSQRTTFYLPKSLHRRLKIADLEEDREISAIVEELVEGWPTPHS